MFQVMPRRKNFGKAEKDIVKADLLEWANLPQNEGKELKQKDYKEWQQESPNKSTSLLSRNGRVSISAISDVFGNWEGALAAIDRIPHKIDRRTDEELIQYFLDVWEWNTEGNYDKELMPTPAILAHYIKDKGLTKNITRYTFESRWVWSKFKELMFRYQQNHITIDDVIKAKKSKEIDDPVSKGDRYKVLKRDNFTCVLCGKTAENGGRLDVFHADHIIHRSRGGSSTDLNNLRTLCMECNLGRGTLD